jgi:murein L,D-transpeptidase YcbB/YkuD
VLGSANFSQNILPDHIQMRLDAALESPVMLCGGAVTYAPAVLQELYRTRMFQPTWIGNDGPLPQMDALLNAIRQAGQEGLKPEEYHLSEITALVSEWRTSRESNFPFPIARQIDLEFLLTDALVAYGFHLLNGRVDSKKLYPDWVSYSKDVHLPAVIENIINGGNLEAAFRRLTPQEPLYRDLKQALAGYADIARTGGWPLIREQFLQTGTVALARAVRDERERERPGVRGEHLVGPVGGRVVHDHQLIFALEGREDLTDLPEQQADGRKF